MITLSPIPRLCVHNLRFCITTDTEESDSEGDKGGDEDAFEDADFEGDNADNPWLAREVRIGAAQREQLEKQEWVHLIHNLDADLSDILKGMCVLGYILGVRLRYCEVLLTCTRPFAARANLRDTLRPDLAPDEGLARELKSALFDLSISSAFGKAKAVVECLKQVVAPTGRRLRNKETGEEVIQLPTAERSRKQKPTHSSI